MKQLCESTHAIAGRVKDAVRELAQLETERTLMNEDDLEKLRKIVDGWLPELEDRIRRVISAVENQGDSYPMVNPVAADRIDRLPEPIEATIDRLWKNHGHLEGRVAAAQHLAETRINQIILRLANLENDRTTVNEMITRLEGRVNGRMKDLESRVTDLESGR